MIVNNNVFKTGIESIFSPSKSKVNDSNLFKDALDSLSKKENQFTSMKEEYLNGTRDDIDTILVEGQKLNLEIGLALQVRNNLVSAMQTIMSMQV